jgi:S1-C subfamily serine protease
MVRRDVEFQVHDVSEDREARLEMVRVSGQSGVPTLCIGGRAIVDLDLERLNQLFPRRVQGIVLGVAVADARRAGDRPPGAYVGHVEADTPADRAGILKGDLIIEMAQRPVRSANDVHAIASQIVPGSRIPVTLWRAGHVFRIVLRT